MKKILYLSILLMLCASPALAHSNSDQTTSNSATTTVQADATSEIDSDSEDTEEIDSESDDTEEQSTSDDQATEEEIQNSINDITAQPKEKLKDLEKVADKVKKLKSDKKKDYLEGISTAYEEAGDINKAIEVQEEAVQEDNADKETFENLGKLYEKKGDKKLKAFVNGNQIVFDVPPVIKNGRTIVPLRAITEALGATVKWNPETQTITIERDGIVIDLTIGSTTALVNGQEVQLDVPSYIANKRTLVPLRFVSEIFQAKVDWIATGQIIVIDQPAATGGTSTTPTDTTSTTGGTTTTQPTDTTTTTGTTTTQPTDTTTTTGGTTTTTTTGGTP